MEKEEEKQLFSYKKIFDQAGTQLGVVKPPMGGAGYNNQILNGASKAGKEPINVTVLSQRPILNLLHIPKMKEKLHQAVRSTINATRQDKSNEDRMLDDLQLEKKLRRGAVSILDGMLATVTSTALKFCGWLMLTLLRQLTSAIHIHEGQLEILKLVLQDEKPVIYFPLHFSHFDYILLSLITYHNELRSPFVASGNNLLIQPFSAIMRRVGGFFIRRKIDEESHRDMIYRALLHAYFTELLKSQQSLEIFIEGTRTRSGLPNLPKTGLLSVAVEALLQGEVDDVTMVPICISYEKVLEGTFRDELMGRSKTPETFFSSMSSICKMLCGFYGQVRVNIGVPQSMKETLHELLASTACEFTSALPQPASNKSPTDSQRSSLLEISPKRKLPPNDSSPLIYHGPNTDNQIRELVTFLGERIVYSSLTCKVLMSTNLVAFLLLHRWRTGVSLPQLVESFRLLTSDLLSRNSDVGFSGDYTDVVLHAIDLLGSDLVTVECTSRLRRSSSSMSVRSRWSADSGYDGAGPERPDEDGPETGNYMSHTQSGNTFNSTPKQEFFSDTLTRRSSSKEPVVELRIEPVLTQPNVFDLAYYANALAPLFALESVVALSVGAMLKCRLSTIMKRFNHVDTSSIQLSADELPECVFRSFTCARLIEKTLELIDILQMDLILCDVTKNLGEAISEAVVGLTCSGCLVAADYGNSATTRKSQAAQDLGFDENERESETWIKLNIQQLPSFLSLQSVMCGFVEGYLAAATQLVLLLDGTTPMQEAELKNKMLLAAQYRVVHGLASASESSSSDIIRNAMRSFQWNQIIVREPDKQYRLADEYKDTDSLSNLVSRISQFLS